MEHAKLKVSKVLYKRRESVQSFRFHFLLVRFFSKSLKCFFFTKNKVNISYILYNRSYIFHKEVSQTKLMANGHDNNPTVVLLAGRH